MSGGVFTYDAQHRARQNGTITPEGSAWLSGYERASNWEEYSIPCRGGFMLLPPDDMPDAMLRWFNAGAKQAAQDRQGGMTPYPEGQAGA